MNKTSSSIWQPIHSVQGKQKALQSQENTENTTKTKQTLSDRHTEPRWVTILNEYLR